MSIITPPVRARMDAAHTLHEQLAALREIERKQILKESCDRILREAEELPKRLILPIEGAD